MKKITIALILSLLLNIFLVSYDNKPKENQAIISMGVASTFDILFEVHEEFQNEFKKYQIGEISLEDLKNKGKDTTMEMWRIIHILDAYEFIPNKYSGSLVDLMSYYNEFTTYSDAVKISTMTDISETIRKNHELSVTQYYEGYPNYLQGEIPEAMIKLFEDINQILEVDSI